MIYVKGVVLTCRSYDREFTDKRDGKKKEFKAHRCWIHDPNSEADPIVVETGETYLVPGTAYRLGVSFRPWVGKNGEPHVQISKLRDYVPEEINLKPPPAGKAV